MDPIITIKNKCMPGSLQVLPPYPTIPFLAQLLIEFKYHACFESPIRPPRATHIPHLHPQCTLSTLERTLNTYYIENISDFLRVFKLH